MNFNIHPLIKVIAIDIYVIIVVNSFYKLGLKDGCKMEKDYLKIENERKEEMIDKLIEMIFKIKSGE